MAGAHGDGFIHSNMEIDVKLQPHFPHQTLLDLAHAGHRRRRGSNRGHDLAPRSGIHDFVQRGIEQPPAVGPDQAQAKSAAHASALCQAGPPSSAMEMPMKAAIEVSASVR